MDLFKRSPSKVWWASDSLEWREVSSPGSQDSGFSDTDTPPLQIQKTVPNKPENLSINFQEKSTPSKEKLPGRKKLYAKNSPRVSRNLFRIKDGDQYAEEVSNGSGHAVLEEVKEDDEVLNCSLASDCESELECLFYGGLESPKCTSTPKMDTRGRGLLKKRFAAPSPEGPQNPAVQMWMREIQNNYEQECMTSLQVKSISGELNQKVAQMATYTTTNIRSVLAYSECLRRDYKNLNSEKKHIGPLVQSLTGNIIDFLKTNTELTPRIAKQYDAIRKASADDLLNLVRPLFTQWESSFHSVLEKEVKKLVERLEKPCSELDLRATTTGITSLCLRNENLIEIFTKNDVIPILLILCEKCEGSSLRSLLLRALTTICATTYAVRQFEKFSGIQIITETLAENLPRPEPERSEAVALLAQVTAPWIEDNHCLKGLQEHSRRLVKCLSKFLSTTKCCQNLLLCAAALANLSSMDPKSIKYMLHLQTVEALLAAVNRRGPCASIYLLEQVASLLANMTASDVARRHLATLPTVSALLCFLRSGNVGEDVEKRLQQKAIIALSRLCGEKQAAEQVVELGGVEKLVRLCREKDERFCNDAVLVATLATLRKIAEVCGKEVISVEDAQELVEPKLLDSFLAYSAQSESYV